MAARPSPTATLPCRSSCSLVRGRYLHSGIRPSTGWLALIAIALQVSCSGGAGGPGAGRVNPLPSVTLSISPGSAHISAGASIQFTVILQNASNPAVVWQVNGIPGGNSRFGTIASSGPLVASYTAPASVSATLTVTVTAALQANATQSASAMVTVNPMAGPQITISPANTTVVQGTSVQFSAAVQNGPQAVIWEVNNIAGGSASVGTISSAGFYTAPIQIPNPPNVTITALLFSNSSVSASTGLKIVAPLASVSISPTTANVLAGRTLQFSATVQNSNSTVGWAVNGASGGNSTFGTISSSGGNTATYTAPASIPASPSPFTVTVTAALQANSSIFGSAGVTVISANTLAGVYSWRNDNSLTGQNGQETALTPSTITGATGKAFGKLFGCPVDGTIFAQPLYVANVAIPSHETHNVVYVATANDSVYAFDADNLCNVLWHVTFTDPVNAITAVPAADIQGQTDIMPLIGITGTPVIDPNTATLYVVSKTKINQGVPTSYDQQLHALDLTTGAERPDSPAIVKANVNGVAFDPLYQNQRSALLLAAGNVYVAFDSYADAGTFHGWVFAYNAANLQTPPAVFSSTPNGFGGGVGESGAAPSSDVGPSSGVSGNVFVVTSDGTFDANSGGPNYGETLLKLQMNSTPPVADYFTPWNERILTSSATPFGSTGVLLLPNSAGGGVPLAVAGSHAGSLYLVDRNNLGKFSTVVGVDNVVQTLCLGAAVTSTPAYWVDNGTATVYTAPVGSSLMSFPLAKGQFASQPCSSGLAQPATLSTDTFPLFGASPVISWDGTNASSGIIWALDTSGYLASPPQATTLHAYDPTNLANKLYASPSTGNGAAGGAVKFAVPTVANGRVYIGTQLVNQTGTQGELSVFGLQ